LPCLQAAAQLRRLLQCGGGPAARRVAHAARARRAAQGVRADRRSRAEGPPDRLPVPPQLAVGLHQPPERGAQCAGWPVARDRPEDGDPVARVNPGLHPAMNTMTEFLLKRLATTLPTLVFVSMLIFGLQQLLPGDPAKILAGEEQDPHVIAYLHAKLHLDDPLPLRYAYWVGGVLHGDLGESVRNQQPVLDLVLQKLPVTVELAAIAFLIALVIGIPAGIISAVARGTVWDTLANAFALWGISTPNFWLGILLILLFSVQLGWLPASGYVPPSE